MTKRKGTDPNPLPPPPQANFALSEDDMQLLEALCKSPVYAAMKRLLAIYKAEATSILETTSDTHKVFQTQGRLIGMRSIENLPILIQEWHKRREASAKYEAEKAKRDSRLRAQDPRPPLR